MMNGDKMRILFVSGSFNQGGAEFQILSLANLMKENGHEVYVIALTDYDFYKKYLTINGISFHCLRNSDKKIVRIRHLAQFIKHYRPQAIIAFLKNTSFATILAKVLSGINCKLLLGERTALVKPVRDFFHFSLWHYADVVTTNSVSKLEYLKKNFPFLRKKLYLVKNVFSQDNYLPATGIESFFKSEYINLIFVGRISPEKNIHKLINALPQLKYSGKGIRLHLFGDARNIEYKSNLVELIKENNLAEMVLFRDAVSQHKLKQIYAQADLICLLSDYEGFSNVLAESMMQGCIPLVSDIPENTQVVKPGFNGFVAKLSDSDSIRKQLQEFLSLKPDQITQMRQNNRQLIQEFLDPKQIYQAYINLLS
jgi:GalNAc-alpha-(1->4)-GalNAc-alpha-(1->3)-diNAcBac-PP-undecaprenol alpha-1,4-N-acetyl-D-galactosaminyltransferase